MVRTMVLVFTLIAAILAPQAIPDLSGTWSRDPAAGTATGGGRGQRDTEGGGLGGGLGLGPAADQLIIVQTPGRLVISGRRGEETSTTTYALNGKKTTNPVQAGRNSGATAASVSSWRGARLETTVNVVPVNGRGAAATYKEVRYLGADGSLVVEITRPDSPNKRTVVYRRISTK
jgi:hypothetical protein